MINARIQVKREPVNLAIQGYGIFEYPKVFLFKDNRLSPFTSLTIREARETIEALTKVLETLPDHSFILPNDPRL